MLEMPLQPKISKMSHNSHPVKLPELDPEAMKAHLEAIMKLIEPVARLEGKVVYGKNVQRIRARPENAITELFTYIKDAEKRSRLIETLTEMHGRMADFEQNWHVSRAWQSNRKPNKRTAT